MFIYAVPVSYTHLSNGAAVVEMKSGQSIYRQDISAETTAAILEILKEFPVQPSAYIEGQMYDYEQIDLENLKAVHGIGSLDKRIRVPDLAEFIRERGVGVEKLFVLYLDRSCAVAVKEALADIPGILFTSSGECNMEINAAGATKGNALAWLCSRLNICLLYTSCFQRSSSRASCGVSHGFPGISRVTMRFLPAAASIISPSLSRIRLM